MRLTQDQRAQAFELHASGMSYHKIARELGCSDSTVRQLFKPRKKPKPVATTMPAKIKPKPKTPSVLIHHVRTSSSVPMRRRILYPPLTHSPSRNELIAMLHQAVKNTRC
jgi:transposase-like protein